MKLSEHREKMMRAVQPYQDRIARLEEMLIELIDCHYGAAIHHIGDGDGIPSNMAEKIKAYWADKIKEFKDG